MPTTKKESLIFGVIMCFGMVLVMASYNLVINEQIGHMSVGNIILEIFIGFCIALILDLFLVGPVAKMITFKLPFGQSKKLFVVLSMSIFMVLGMVFFMSIFGLVTFMMSNGLNGQGMIEMYLMIYLKNFIVAFPLQLLVMGPFVRFIFIKFIKREKENLTLATD
ncbi:DUF2798 domain-containing protein [Bacillus sp. CLL-7-23]|uniref:DUF2798 domain-containing protein n=1 Tax=Bacillus changyiensis TaxID=3004103 RepID=A0ABT4X7G7_9BACI|nr:DUF2798 domain-containing protein [Bacillus changyiensis]MDA7028216.1 DUF2798 domain-containing protein [Bacillus changyiensis]